MNLCRLCRDDAVMQLRNFGALPVCNRFLENAGDEETAFPMILGHCGKCGLVQLINAVEPRNLKTRYSWITYTEPSSHLPRLAETVAGLPGISADSIVCGVFLPTDPSLSWFESAGFEKVWRLEIGRDLGIDDPCAGTETIQQSLTRDTAADIAKKRGRPDVVLVRHILEHTHAIEPLMAGIRRLVKPDGYVVFEVPDCEPHFDSCDYTTLWEEHVSYFTRHTFLRCLGHHNWRIVHEERAGPSLLAIASPANDAKESAASVACQPGELSQARSFADKFPEVKSKIAGFISDYVRKEKRVAVFGAGHLACVFINLMEIGKYLHGVIDDSKHKQGMFMPGSRLPIMESRALVADGITLCLSSLGAETDERILKKNPFAAEFAARGGRMLSLLPGRNFFADHPLRG